MEPINNTKKTPIPYQILCGQFLSSFKTRTPPNHIIKQINPLKIFKSISFMPKNNNNELKAESHATVSEVRQAEC